MPITPADSLELRNLTVHYGASCALDAVSLFVEPGEFVSILGPSGCGKSTLLRAIAGLERASAGAVMIGGAEVTDNAPKERGVAFVFQSYALYPHMTCRQNIAAPLVMTQLSSAARLRALGWLVPGARATKEKIAEKVMQTAQLLQIEPILDRYPSSVSGGQQQRVALARALIREPKLFLLDEPLANLDAALRHQTRFELRALQKRVRATTLFVTHDQAEAMAMSDRVVVMFGGRIRQIGTPDELYREPVDLEVAQFLSQPHLNVIPAHVLRKAAGDRTGAGSIEIQGKPLGELSGMVAIRPEHAAIRPVTRPGLPGPLITVEMIEHGGVSAYVYAQLDADARKIVVRISSDEIPNWEPGSKAILEFSLSAAHVFEDASDTDQTRAVA